MLFYYVSRSKLFRLITDVLSSTKHEQHVLFCARYFYEPFSRPLCCRLEWKERFVATQVLLWFLSTYGDARRVLYAIRAFQ